MSKAANKVMSMDTKKNGSQKESTGSHFISEVKQEFNRVDWTSKEELKTYTKIVVGSTFFFGLVIYVVDLTLRGTLELINEGFKFLVG
jgi:preprotein translocase subunit SecE